MTKHSQDIALLFALFGKLLALFALAVMSLVCYAAFANPAIAAVQTIDKVEITEVTQPAVGAELSHWAYAPDSSGYTVADTSGDYKKVGWVETKSSPTEQDLAYANRTYTLPGDTDVHFTEFKADCYYTVFVTVYTDDNYVFSDKVSATLNGKAAQVGILDETGIEVFYTYEPVTEVDNVIIAGITTPVAGVAPSWGYALPKSANYHFNNPLFSNMGPNAIAWHEGSEKVTAKDLESFLTYSAGISFSMNFAKNLHFRSGLNYLTGEYDNPLNTFELGKTYTFFAAAYANEGFYFSDDVTAKINGGQGVVYLDPSKVCAIIAYSFDPAKNPENLSSMALHKNKYAYTGKPLTPGVTVKNAAGVELLEDVDYTVSYSKNVNVGKAVVTVTGIGAYTGAISKTFTINPKASKVIKVKPSTKAVTVTWTKRTKQITGYQVRWSTSSKMKKAKSITIKNYKTKSKKIGKLKSKKKYYFQVRTYKKVGGKTYYSNWSKSKTAKAK